MFKDNYKDLACEIIAHAVRDLKNDSPLKTAYDENKRIRARISAEIFFKSEWFEFLCFALGLKSDVIIEKLSPYLDDKKAHNLNQQGFALA